MKQEAKVGIYLRYRQLFCVVGAADSPNGRIIVYHDFGRETVDGMPFLETEKVEKFDQFQLITELPTPVFQGMVFRRNVPTDNGFYRLVGTVRGEPEMLLKLQHLEFNVFHTLQPRRLVTEFELSLKVHPVAAAQAA